MPENHFQTESSVCKNLDGIQLQKDRTMNDMYKKKGKINQVSKDRNHVIGQLLSRDWSVAVK